MYSSGVTTVLTMGQTFTLLMTLDVSSHLRNKDTSFQEMAIKVVTISPQCRLFHFWAKTLKMYSFILSKTLKMYSGSTELRNTFQICSGTSFPDIPHFSSCPWPLVHPLQREFYHVWPLVSGMASPLPSSQPIIFSPFLALFLLSLSLPSSEALAKMQILPQ